MWRVTVEVVIRGPCKAFGMLQMDFDVWLGEVSLTTNFIEKSLGPSSFLYSHVYWFINQKQFNKIVKIHKMEIKQFRSQE